MSQFDDVKTVGKSVFFLNLVFRNDNIITYQTMNLFPTRFSNPGVFVVGAVTISGNQKLAIIEYAVPFMSAPHAYALHKSANV